jgi:hypothetical protein
MVNGYFLHARNVEFFAARAVKAALFALRGTSGNLLSY